MSVILTYTDLMIGATTARPMTVLEITRDYQRLLENAQKQPKNLCTWIVDLLQKFDLPGTIPPMCFRVSRGREVSVQDGNS